MVMRIKLLICLSLILLFQLNKKDFKKIAALLTPMLRIADSLKNLLTSVYMTDEDKVIDKSAIEGVSN